MSEIFKKTFLLVGNSRNMLKKTFEKKNVHVDYICRFSYRWMKHTNTLSNHMGDFNAIITSHYDHKNVIINYHEFNIHEKTNKLFLVSPRNEQYHIEKDNNIDYSEISDEDYKVISNIFKQYGFTKYVPRTGLRMIVWLVFTKQCKVFLYGFDINATDRPSDQDVSEKDHNIDSRHNAKAESIMLQKLIVEGLIHVYDDL